MGACWGPDVAARAVPGARAEQQQQQQQRPPEPGGGGRGSGCGGGSSNSSSAPQKAWAAGHLRRHHLMLLGTAHQAGAAPASRRLVMVVGVRHGVAQRLQLQWSSHHPRSGASQPSSSRRSQGRGQGPGHSATQTGAKAEGEGEGAGASGNAAPAAEVAPKRRGRPPKVPRPVGLSASSSTCSSEAWMGQRARRPQLVAWSPDYVV